MRRATHGHGAQNEQRVLQSRGGATAQIRSIPSSLRTCMQRNGCFHCAGANVGSNGVTLQQLPCEIDAWSHCSGRHQKKGVEVPEQRRAPPLPGQIRALGVLQERVRALSQHRIVPSARPMEPAALLSGMQVTSRVMGTMARGTCRKAPWETRMRCWRQPSRRQESRIA